MGLAITIIMIIGAVFIAIFSLPQLIHVIKTKNTNGVHLIMYFIFLFACICFVIDGFGIVFDPNTNLDEATKLGSGLPILISNAFCVCIALITLVYKFKNLHRAHKAGMTELEYWHKNKNGSVIPKQANDANTLANKTEVTSKTKKTQPTELERK